jgi:lysophospholipid acyltransferase (LPLAT)-like uncharacterized protein
MITMQPYNTGYERSVPLIQCWHTRLHMTLASFLATPELCAFISSNIVDRI